jgi:hypothetical protein
MSDTDDEDEVLDNVDSVCLCNGWSRLDRLHSICCHMLPARDVPGPLVRYANWAMIWEAHEEDHRDRSHLRSMLNTFEHMIGDTPCSQAYVILAPTEDKKSLRALPYGPYSHDGPWPRLLFFNPDNERARDAALGIMGFYEEGDSPVFSPFEDDYYYEEERIQLAIEWREETVASRLERLIEHGGAPIEALLESLPNCEGVIDELVEQIHETY